ncbi:hypothetical protein [Nesterenkonia sp.]|uniref:hypothetical protein n=1 Tax=Nesterenkonia sp. TaxID=704201 RepID=UPI002610F7D1|nr:hypothetical protein [Nesterenkonia sp.]
MISELRHASAEQLGLRIAVLAAFLGWAGLAAAVSGRGPTDIWAVGIPLVMGLLAALKPGGLLPLAGLGYLILGWPVLSPDPASAAALVVAGLVLIAHTCCALAAVFPVAAALPAGLLRHYGIRAAVVFAAAGLLWCLVRLFQAAPPPGGAALLLLAVLMVLAGLLLHHRWIRRPAAAQ